MLLQVSFDRTRCALAKNSLIRVSFDYIVDVCFPQINRYYVWSTIVAVVKMSWVLPTLVGSVTFAIFPRTATLSHSFLLLRISRTDNGSSSAVLISEYWNAYSEGCGTETNVMSLTKLSFFSKREIRKLNQCPIRLALRKQLPFVF